MDFKKEEINGSFLKPLFLVLFILPMMLSMSNDCAGKAFHCLNNTHFAICVEVGNGITTIMDNLEIPCPSGTECHANNAYQCQLTRSPTLIPHVKDETITKDPTRSTGMSAIEKKVITRTSENYFNQQEDLSQHTKTERQENTPPTSSTVDKYVTPEDVTMNTIAFVTLSYTRESLVDNKFSFEEDSRPEGEQEELNKSHGNESNISSNEKSWDHFKDKSRVNFTTEVPDFTKSATLGHNTGNVIYGSETLQSTSSIPNDINMFTHIINYNNTNRDRKYTTNQEWLTEERHETTPQSLITAVEDQSETVILEANIPHIFVPELESYNLLQTVTETNNQETSQRDITMSPIIKISTDKISGSSITTEKLIEMEKGITGSYEQETVIEDKTTPPSLISAAEDQSETVQLEASTSHYIFVPELEYFISLQTVTETSNQETSKHDITMSPPLKISTDKISESSIITEKLIEMENNVTDSYEQETVTGVKTTLHSLISAVEDQTETVLLGASTSHIFVPELESQTVTETFYYNQEDSKRGITTSPTLNISTVNTFESSIITEKLIEMKKEVSDSNEQEPAIEVKNSINVQAKHEPIFESKLTTPYKSNITLTRSDYKPNIEKEENMITSPGLKDTTWNDMTPNIKVKLNDKNIRKIKSTTPITHNFSPLPAEVNLNNSGEVSIDNNYTDTWPLSTDEIRTVHTKSKTILLDEASHTDQNKISITENPKTDQFNEDKLNTAIQGKPMITEDQEYINNYDAFTTRKIITKAEEKLVTIGEMKNVKTQTIKNSINEVNLVSAADSNVAANTKDLKVTNGFYITTPLNEVKSNIVTMDTKFATTTNTYDIKTLSDKLQLINRNTVMPSDLSRKSKFKDEKDDSVPTDEPKISTNSHNKEHEEININMKSSSNINDFDEIKTTVADDQHKLYEYFNNTQTEYGAILINGLNNVTDKISQSGEIFQSSESVESKEVYEPSSKSDITEILHKNLSFYPRKNSTISLDATRHTTFGNEVTTTNNMLVLNSYLEPQVNTKEKVRSDVNKYSYETLTTTVKESSIYEEQNKGGKSNITNSLLTIDKNIENSHIKTVAEDIHKLANISYYENLDINKPFSEQDRNDSYEEPHVTHVESSFMSNILTPETDYTKSFNEDKIIINYKPKTENSFIQEIFIKASSSGTLITPTTSYNIIDNVTNNTHGVTGALVGLENIKKVVDVKPNNVSTITNDSHNTYSPDIYISTESLGTVTTHNTIYEIQSDKGDPIYKTIPNYKTSKTTESLPQVLSSSTIRPTPTVFHPNTKSITATNNELSTLFPKLITKHSIRNYVATEETQIPSYNNNISPTSTVSSNIPTQDSIQPYVKANVGVETGNKNSNKNVSEKWDEVKRHVSMNSIIENSTENKYFTQNLYNITTPINNKPLNVSNQLGYRSNYSSSSVNKTGYMQTMRHDKIEEGNSKSYFIHTTNRPYSTFSNKVTQNYNPNKSSTNDQSLSKDNVNQTLTNNLSSINCANQKRGKFADLNNCRKFYACIGKFNPIVRYCPNNTVFSDIKKQCTTNLSHCVRNNSFQCVKEGRFSDYFDNNAYYICVQKKQNHFYRLKFQCRNGYYLDKNTVKCVVNIPVGKSKQSSKSSSIENKSIKVMVEKSSKTKLKINDSSSNEDVDFKCHHEGKFSYPGNCRKYYICETKKGSLRRKKKKCNRHKVFDKKHSKCVNSESYECND